MIKCSRCFCWNVGFLDQLLPRKNRRVKDYKDKVYFQHQSLYTCAFNFVKLLYVASFNGTAILGKNRILKSYKTIKRFFNENNIFVKSILYVELLNCLALTKWVSNCVLSFIIDIDALVNFLHWLICITWISIECIPCNISLPSVIFT